MGKFFFSGSDTVKLDEKNRFVLPQNMRLGLVEDGVLEFTIALGLGGCLVIYKRSDIDRIITSFRNKAHIAKYRKFFTLFFSTLFPTTCDKVGRVILPQHLKKAVNIKNEIVVAGVLDKIEIWPKERYEFELTSILENKDPEFDLIKMSEEAFALVGSEVFDEQL